MMLVQKVATSTVAAWFTQARPFGQTPMHNRSFKRLRPHVTWPASFTVRAAASIGGSGSAGGSEDDETAISGFRGFGSFDKQQQQYKKKMSTGDALQNSLADLSAAVGRTSQTNNIIMGDSQSEDKWRELDAQVNEYPSVRTFKAIGDGGEDFVKSMRAAAEAVLGPLHEECVSTRLSKGGKYTSVSLTARVETPEQVLAIYERMRADERMRFFF